MRLMKIDKNVNPLTRKVESAARRRAPPIGHDGTWDQFKCIKVMHSLITPPKQLWLVRSVIPHRVRSRKLQLPCPKSSTMMHTCFQFLVNPPNPFLLFEISKCREHQNTNNVNLKKNMLQARKQTSFGLQTQTNFDHFSPWSKIKKFFLFVVSIKRPVQLKPPTN